MMTKKFMVLPAVLLLTAAGAFAQTDSHTVSITVAQIGVIALNDTSTISFSTQAPALPGDLIGPLPAAPATNSTKSLFYTTANLVTKTRHITVQSDVNPPGGTSLTVNAAMAAGAGTNVGPATISTTAADLVRNIGSVATGRVAGTSGATLTYSFWVSDQASLVASAAATDLLVTYTMTADSF